MRQEKKMKQQQKLNAFVKQKRPPGVAPGGL
jgi:hypothetical protein